MRQFLARLLRQFGSLDFELLSQSHPTFPDEIEDYQITIVKNGGVEKWACFSCPGGCGERIDLSLNPNRRPRWTISWDFWTRPTIKPSVHQKNECGCHFWVRNGRVDWCKGGRPNKRSRLNQRL
ncbi:DUF6527 family protein [Algimonas ampicilliniresistens]|uniref:DUF6527 family protein n=1 Tax=Algimonas ampicilliniresistens TaxID=1298735 RepID=UPI0032AECC03